MTNTSIYQSIATRTSGDIYIGVVGPVRSGKSTFIKRFMELLVLPNMTDGGNRERAVDEAADRVPVREGAADVAGRRVVVHDLDEPVVFLGEAVGSAQFEPPALGESRLKEENDIHVGYCIKNVWSPTIVSWLVVPTARPTRRSGSRTCRHTSVYKA